MTRADYFSLQEMTAGIYQQREATQKSVSAQDIQESLRKLKTDMESLKIQIWLLINRFVPKYHHL